MTMLLCCLFLCNNKRAAATPPPPSCMQSGHFSSLASRRPWICLNLHSLCRSVRPSCPTSLAVIELAAYSPFKLQTRP